MEIKLNNYYFHSVVNDYRGTFITVKEIIGDKVILSPKQRSCEKRFGCHNDDEICLSKVTPTYMFNNVNSYVSSIELFLDRLLTFIIDKEFDKKHEVYKPHIVTTDDLLLKPYLVDGKHTNLYDEYRTKDAISINYLRGIIIPLEELTTDPSKFLTFVDKQALIDLYNYGFDSSFEQYIRINQGGEDKRIERKQALENFMKQIKILFDDIGIDMPIYDYKEGDKILKRTM